MTDLSANDYRIVSNEDLLREVADGEVVAMIYGGYSAYGWTHMIHSLSRGHSAPLRLFVSHHTFKFAARRALARWIEVHRWPAESRTAAEGIREWKP